MKYSMFKWGIAPVVVCALLAPTPMLAQAVRFKSTGWLIAELLPGIQCISASGQVSLKGEVHAIRMVSDDPRGAGRVQAVMDLVVQADGTSTFSGTACLEVGTWDAAGAFTRTGGVWDTNYKGIVHTDGTTEYDLSGVGIGGSIDGLHIKAAATRKSTSPSDPYLFSGMITAVGRDKGSD